MKTLRFGIDSEPQFIPGSLPLSGWSRNASDLFSCVISNSRYHLKLLHARKKEPGGKGVADPHTAKSFPFLVTFFKNVVLDHF